MNSQTLVPAAMADMLRNAAYLLAVIVDHRVRVTAEFAQAIEDGQALNVSTSHPCTGEVEVEGGTWLFRLSHSADGAQLHLHVWSGGVLNDLFLDLLKTMLGEPNFFQARLITDLRHELKCTLRGVDSSVWAEYNRLFPVSS